MGTGARRMLQQQFGISSLESEAIPTCRRPSRRLGKTVMDSPPREIMRLQGELKPRRYEARVQELSRERKSEVRQAERLAALLSKKKNPNPIAAKASSDNAA